MRWGKLWSMLALDLEFFGDVAMSSMLLQIFFVKNRASNSYSDHFINFTVVEESDFQHRFLVLWLELTTMKWKKIRSLLFLTMTRVILLVVPLTCWMNVIKLVPTCVRWIFWHCLSLVSVDQLGEMWFRIQKVTRMVSELMWALHDLFFAPFKPNIVLFIRIVIIKSHCIILHNLASSKSSFFSK